MGEEMRSSWPAGSTLEGWLLTKTGSGTPRWALEPDGSAPSKGLVLKQSGSATFPVALMQGQSVRDGARARGSAIAACNSSVSSCTVVITHSLYHMVPAIGTHRAEPAARISPSIEKPRTDCRHRSPGCTGTGRPAGGEHLPAR